jgi:hypothetical protein
MRKICILFILIFIFNANVSYAQPVDSGPIVRKDQYRFRAEFPEMTKEQHDAMWKRVFRKADSLVAVGAISPANPSSATLYLQWPLLSTLSDYGYHRMGHFPDHNDNTSGYNHLLDYNGGDRTYDRRDGYNHAGTDFYGWPFDWHKMDNDEVIVVAAAPGRIIDKEDGHYDRRCYDLDHGTFDFNSIYIRHDDGTYAWYVHFKENSLTNKPEGQDVEVGEYLGVIGASGWAWEPHLHFELSSRREDGHDGNYMIDPNVGPNNTAPRVRWADGIQRPYYDSAINKLMTHSAPPDFTVPCPTPAIINEKNDFNPGETVYVAAYYRDQREGQTAQYTIYRPDNSIFQTWTHTIDHDFPNPSTLEPDWSLASYWYWGWTLPPNAPAGMWKVEAVYMGNTYEHYFIVFGDPSLPVFLSSFQLEQKDNSVLLTWSTESEVNNQGFIIKRKTSEESQYREIANCSHNHDLIGRGTYSGNSVYSYKDSNILANQYYQYQLLSVTYLGSEEVIASGEIQINDTYASILPRDVQLFQNYPNPFNGFTIIPYFLPEAMSFNISVYDLLGQKILTLVDSEKKEGNYNVVWNTNNSNLNSGVYFVVLKTPGTTISNRCLLIK